MLNLGWRGLSQISGRFSVPKGRRTAQRNNPQPQVNGEDHPEKREARTEARALSE